MSNELRHLASKERRIGDLIQFVKTRTSHVSNYTILLGAGASVTSGVRSAGELIEEWRKELYERYCSNLVESPYTPQNAKSFFTREHASWYSSEREYASLFERKFDLPRQRRMFVEREVDGKQPSIGYAYLIRLIEENYFNAVFTTNFDDLLNEAFHQFSEDRPLICAHDSSISSITVTSKRPKVIKLHGDYLFDDIKSTVRETESLESNTKAKFVEFAKDHGLIVVGYSGHDRSIMDVLQSLLKRDDYLKHGIYWCIRENDRPSEELIKLLWKDRAYWVKIEGFDEMAAQLYSECVGSSLPISTALVSEHPKEIISRFCNDSRLTKSNSPVIQRDMGRLRLEMDQEALVETLRTLTVDHGDEDKTPTDLTDRDLIRLMAIRQLLRERDYEGALAKVAEELAKAGDQEFKLELLSVRLRVENATDDYTAAIATCETLISLDPNDAFHYLKRAENERSQEKRLGSVAKALELDPYYPSAFRLRAVMREEQLDGDPGCDSAQLISLVESDYRKSLELDPSISNMAWDSWIKFLVKNKPPFDERNPLIEEELGKLKSLDAFSGTYLRAALTYTGNLTSDAQVESKLLAEIKKAVDVQPSRRKKKLELIRLRALIRFEKTSELLALASEFDADVRWEREPEYIELRARIYAETEGKLHDAIRKIQSFAGHRRRTTMVTRLITYLCYAKRTDEAQLLLDEAKITLGPSVRDDMQIAIYGSLSQYEKELGLVRKKKREQVFPAEETLSEVHTLLHLARYDEAEAVSRAVLDPAHFAKPFDALILNFEIARQRQGHKVDKPRLQKIAERNRGSKEIGLCAYFLLDEKDRAADLMRKLVQKDRTYAYILKEWALFSTTPNKNWLTSTLSSKGLDPGIAVLESKKAAV
jgi:tetratricopeptide (TPR) repeat protein/NAD-dependent SIR2 family protein deacetylase